MPADMAAKSATLGAVNGFWTIGWIILNVIFLYSLTKEKGLFQVFQHSLGRITADRRLQILLIPFCFGAFFEGAAGFGTPVAVCSAMLMGLGFSPLTSAAMALFANTATVAFGAIGAPINGLAAVHRHRPSCFWARPSASSRCRFRSSFPSTCCGCSAAGRRPWKWRRPFWWRRCPSPSRSS